MKVSASTGSVVFLSEATPPRLLTKRCSSCGETVEVSVAAGVVEKPVTAVSCVSRGVSGEICIRKVYEYVCTFGCHVVAPQSWSTHERTILFIVLYFVFPCTGGTRKSSMLSCFGTAVALCSSMCLCLCLCLCVSMFVSTCHLFWTPVYAFLGVLRVIWSTCTCIVYEIYRLAYRAELMRPKKDRQQEEKAGMIGFLFQYSRGWG